MFTEILLRYAALWRFKFPVHFLTSPIVNLHRSIVRLGLLLAAIHWPTPWAIAALIAASSTWILAIEVVSQLILVGSLVSHPPVSQWQRTHLLLRHARRLGGTSKRHAATACSIVCVHRAVVACSLWLCEVTHSECLKSGFSAEFDKVWMFHWWTVNRSHSREN